MFRRGWRSVKKECEIESTRINGGAPYEDSVTAGYDTIVLQRLSKHCSESLPLTQSIVPIAESRGPTLSSDGYLLFWSDLRLLGTAFIATWVNKDCSCYKEEKRKETCGHYAERKKTVVATQKRKRL